VRNMAIGSQLARAHLLECVTVDGDRVSGTGLLTGGYIDARSNRLQAWIESAGADKISQAASAESAAKRAELDGAQQAHLVARNAHAAARDAHQRASAAAEQQAIEVGDGGDDVRSEAPGRSSKRGRRESCSAQQHSKALEALRAAAEQDRAKLADLVAQRDAPFATALTDGERAKLAELQTNLAELERECVVAQRARADAVASAIQIEGELSEDLLRREQELGEAAAELEAQRVEAARLEAPQEEAMADGARGSVARDKADKRWPVGTSTDKNGTRRRAADGPGASLPATPATARRSPDEMSEEMTQMRTQEELTEVPEVPDVPADATGTHGVTQEGEASSAVPTPARRDVGHSSSNESSATRLAEAKAALAKSIATCEATAKAVELGREEECASLELLEHAKSQHAAAVAEAANGAREGSELSARHAKATERVERGEKALQQAGALPADALCDDAAISSKSSKALRQEVDACEAQLEKIGHVNKKALDQFVTFSEQRSALRARWKEVDEGERSIQDLIHHLDTKRKESLDEMFTAVARHFRDVFGALVPGGRGELVLMYPPGQDDDGSAPLEPRGVAIRVRFGIGGDTQTMAQLSGGQKTMVALCLIFAIQRCDPAPFYIFDEIDAALDATHRSSLAAMILQQSATVDEHGRPRKPTQFITTTFRPELIQAGQQFYGVSHSNKASTIRKISMAEAHRIVAEDKSRAKQHAGANAVQAERSPE